MLNPLGTKLTILMGPTVALPVPPSFAQSVRSVEVTQTDEGRSGFQLKLAISRSTDLGALDYTLFSSQVIRPFYRTVIIAIVGGIPNVLMDGVITHQQVTPSKGSQGAELILTGEDLSVLMDLKEQSKPYPAMNIQMIVNAILLPYAAYGITPSVIPALDTPPLPIDWIPVQHGTDLDYILSLAAQCGYVFYLSPGPAPMVNTAYFGPPKRLGLPQPAISVNMGSATNVDSIQFKYDGLAPTTVSGSVLEFKMSTAVPIEVPVSSRLPPLALEPALLVNQPNHVREQLSRHTGQDVLNAMLLAKGTVDRSTDRVVTAEGELSVQRYGGVLQSRGLVGVRGAGFSYDGLYYVKKITHQIQGGTYKQKFTLTREGLGSLTPVVRP